MKHIKSWSLNEATKAWSALKDSKKKFSVGRSMTRENIYDEIESFIDANLQKEQKIQLAEALSSDALCQKFVKGYFELQDELAADDSQDSQDAFSEYITEFMMANDKLAKIVEWADRQVS